MLDIGGGSLKVAMGSDAETGLVASLPLGARRLTRAFLAGDRRPVASCPACGAMWGRQ